MKPSSIRLLFAAGICCSLATPANAEPTGLLVGQFPGDTTYDRIWSAFTLYKDENNPILQEFALQGRYQAQWADGESSTEDYRDSGRGEYIGGSDIESRRFRLGFKSKWFQNWKFDGQIDVDSNFEDNQGDCEFYKQIYDLYVTYAPSDAFNASVGKTKVKFTREQEISSKEILTIERSGLSNMLFPGELTGAWVSGKGIGGHWLYEAGLYGADRQREFSDFNGDYVFLGKIGYDYAEQAGLDTAVVSLHYMHNSAPGDQYMSSTWSGSSSPSFSHSVALTNDITKGRFGLTTDLVFASGYDGTAVRNGVDTAIDQGDVFGFSVIPSYYIAEGLQLVGRFQYGSSCTPDMIKPPGRYEEASGLPNLEDVKGNTFYSTYLGLNYYIYGHKLKLMTGAEYTHLGGGDYSGTTFYAGARMSF